MERFILQLGNMSLQASIVICVVLLVRILFAKLGIAKKYMNLLWILPYLCMICPWKLEGDFGFWRQYGSGAVDSTYEAKEDIIMTGNANIAHTVADGNAFDSTFDNLLQNVTNNQVNDVSGMDVVQLLLAICCIVWLAGIIGLLIYSADAHLKLHKKLICCMHLTENIYLADDITVPFVMGVWKPRIYLPSYMPMDGFHYVIAHEKTHIHRRDPLKKILAYIITCLHWFNPLAWVAFYFFGKDMEMACDEETVLGLGISHKQDYATVLLSMSSGKKLFLGTPLAFGEGNVKGRIKNIVKYKKTWHVLSLLAIAVIMVLAVGFMTKEATYVPLSKVQDMVHPPREATTVVISMNGESKKLSAEEDFDKISNFLRDIEIEKGKKSLSRSEERPMDIVIELGVNRFCFTADYHTIWSDNDVKPSFSHQVKEPEEVRAFVEGLIASAEEEGQTINVIQVPHELTMEEVIELVKTNQIKEAFVDLPQAETLPYTNLIEDKNENDIALNWNYFCEFSYEGSDFRLQISYYKPDIAAKYGKNANELDFIVLSYYPGTLSYYPNGASIKLYDGEHDLYTIANDMPGRLSAFFAQKDEEYHIEQYFTCTLPEGTYVSEFKGLRNTFVGSEILGDFKEIEVCKGAPTVAFLPGGLGVSEQTDIMEFKNGRPVSVRWHENHSGFSTQGQYLEGCEMPAILYEGFQDLFTAAEFEEYTQKYNVSAHEIITTSDFWFVFFGEEDGQYVYTVFLNQAYFIKEDVIALARSVKFTEQ